MTQYRSAPFGQRGYWMKVTWLGCEPPSITDGV